MRLSQRNLLKQARFFLGTTEVWCAQDGDFNLEEFHTGIMQLFELDTAELANEWATETLAWWNMYVS